MDNVSRTVGRLVTVPIRKILFEKIHPIQKDLTFSDLKQLLDDGGMAYLQQLMTSLLKQYRSPPRGAAGTTLLT